jgi:Malectin domain
VCFDATLSFDQLIKYRLTHSALQTQYYQTIGSRIFDVFIEGVIVADNLDIFLAAGGNNSYIVTSFPFVADGNITIDFVAGTAGDPQINGIEVFDNGNPIPPPTEAPVALPPNAAPVAPTSNTTFQDIVINCGGAHAFVIFVF